MDWTDTVVRNGHTVTANTVVLLGVLLFGWSASAVLVMYWLETGVAIVRGSVQGLFANQAPEKSDIDQKLPLSSWGEKRGGVSLWTLPPIYPRNVPVVAASVVVLVMLWPIAGVIVLANIKADFTLGALAVGSMSLLIGHGVGIMDFLMNGRYNQRSVRTVLLRRHVMGMFVLGVGGVIGFIYASPPSVLLAFIVIIKMAGDVLTVQWEPTNSLTEWNEDSVEIRVPDSEPIEIFQVSQLGLFVREAGYTPLYLLLPPYLILTLAAAIAWLIGGHTAGFAFGFAVVIATVISRVVHTAVQTSYLEYHVYPSQVVAYDRLLDTPQWAIKRSEVTDVTVTSSRFDQLQLGGRTVIVSVFKKDRRLKELQRPESFVETLWGNNP